LAQWKAFIRAFVNHIKSDSRRLSNGALPVNYIRALEIWNEPNLPRWWGGVEEPRAADYARVYKEAEAGIDEAGGLPKSTRLISGGLAAQGDVNTYLREFLGQLGPGTYPDGVGIHLYATGETDPVAAVRNIESKYDAIQAVLRDPTLNLPGMPAWVTEVGYPEDPGKPPPQGEPDLPASEANQTEVLRKVYRSLTGLTQPPRDRPLRPASFLVYRVVDEKTNVPGEDKHLFGTARRVGPGEANYLPKSSFCDLAKTARKKASRCPISGG